MIFVNAENLILGRVASFCAKKAMEKEEVMVMNAEKATITGSKPDLLKRFKTKLDLAVKGNPRKGPKKSRMPDKIMRDAIEGMVPHRRKTGRDAIKRVKVFIGTPEEFKDKKVVDLSTFKIDETKNFMHVEELSKLLGAKW